MPKDLSREQVPLGTIAHQWIISEYQQFERSRLWYILVAVIGSGLLAYALFTGNNSFAVIIILFAIIVYIHDRQQPLELNVALTDVGVVIGKRLYRYHELERFWIVYEPGEVKVIYFILNGLVRQRIAVPLADTDPRAIRQFLGQFMTENTDEEEEPLTDKLTRLLKIQ